MLNAYINVMTALLFTFGLIPLLSLVLRSRFATAFAFRGWGNSALGNRSNGLCENLGQCNSERLWLGHGR